MITQLDVSIVGLFNLRSNKKKCPKSVSRNILKKKPANKREHKQSIKVHKKAEK